MTSTHGNDCKCNKFAFHGMLCAHRPDWLEGSDPTLTPPPHSLFSHQDDPDAFSEWARARRTSRLGRRRRRAAHVIRYAIHLREQQLGWRQWGLTEWILR